MDSTAYQQVQVALQRSEELNRRVLDTVAAGIVVVATDGSISHANAEAQRILGLSFDELTQRFIADFAPETLCEDGTPCPVENYPVSRCLATGQQQPPATIGVRRPDGEVAWAVFTAAPLLDPQTHELEGAVVSFLDITERRRAEQRLREMEEQLRQAQKLETIGHLAGGIAHDFNNYLQAILGFCDLALEQLPSRDPVAPYLQEIARAGERAAGLTRKLLAFSRRRALAPALVDPNQVLVEMAPMLEQLLGANVRLSRSLDEALHHIEIEPGQLEQVLVNLMLNSRDAMPQGGSVRIASANVQIEEPTAGRHPPMAPGSYVMLTVSDSGVGMDAETQARIFEPFFTTKDPERGTGLGLPTVYGIVKQSGGYIWVESQPGRGTTFTLYFPSAELAALPALDLEPVQTATGSRSMQATVLVVEDEPGVRELATTILQVHGCHVLSASRASEGLQLAERYTGPIDLVLTDVVMPGMSGRQLAEELLRQRPNLRVLYMSGYTRAMLQPDPGAGAASGYLQKPFAPATLAERVAQLLGT